MLLEKSERSVVTHPRRGAFVRAACSSGIVSGWRFTRRYAIPILAYHGISRATGGAWRPLRQQVSPQEFETHLRALARHYQFVSLETAIDILAGRLPRRPNCVALTFDDGYRNNLTEALPILRRYAAPATVFLPVGNVEARRPLWFDRLDFVLAHLTGPPFSVQVQSREFRLEPGNRTSLARVFAAIRDHAKCSLTDGALCEAMISLAGELEERAGKRLAAVFETDPHCGLVSWSDVRAAAGGLIAFASHTVDHVRLTRVEPREALDQLARSREMLTKQTGGDCRAIAYPNGAWDRRIAKLAADCGYEAGLTSQEGLNTIGCDLLALHRIGIGPGLSESEVLFRTSGLSLAISQRLNQARFLKT